MAHYPTDETRAHVFALTSFGVTQNEIAQFLKISDDTLRKHYSDEIARAAVDRNAEVAAFLYRSASGKAIADGASYSDCLKAAMFWLKTRARWRETNNLEISGPDGGPIRAITDAMTPQEAAEAYAATIATDKG